VWLSVGGFAYDRNHIKAVSVHKYDFFRPAETYLHITHLIANVYHNTNTMKLIINEIAHAKVLGFVVAYKLHRLLALSGITPGGTSPSTIPPCLAITFVTTCTGT
jgi:hypothetical protein